jgi:tetratricopeptide (TPR) repeat protein
MPLAKQAVLKALSLEPDLAEAHASLGHIRLVYDWDLPGASAEFERAIELNPADPTAHQWHALYFNAIGRTTDAVAEINRAHELDPLSPTIHIALSETYYFARDYQQSIAESRKALEMDPNFPLGLLTLGRSLILTGKVDQATPPLQKGLELTHSPAMTTMLAYAYVVKGDRARARTMLGELLEMPRRRPPLYVSALYPAGIYAALGEKETAFKYLDQALEERCEYLVYLHRDPMADPVRSDPRFGHLLQSTGLHPSTSSQLRWTQ